jgi:hypothetical protein
MLTVNNKGYVADTFDHIYSGINDKVVGISNGGSIAIIDSAYDSSDATVFKTAMSGVYLIYELATPTTETADPYQQVQIVDNYGTEEFVIDSGSFPVPVGHQTRYMANLKAKLEGLPWDMSMIAPTENKATASRAYSAGQYFLKGNQFCKALTSIASGATFTLNTNYTVTTVASELYTALHS